MSAWLKISEKHQLRAAALTAAFVVASAGVVLAQTRTPDAHFYTEVRYKGAKSVVICPDYSEASKFADLWISVKQGTDAALAMAMGHVILREFYLDRQADPAKEDIMQTRETFLGRLLSAVGFTAAIARGAQEVPKHLKRDRVELF